MSTIVEKTSGNLHTSQFRFYNSHVNLNLFDWAHLVKSYQETLDWELVKGLQDENTNLKTVIDGFNVLFKIQQETEKDLKEKIKKL